MANFSEQQAREELRHAIIELRSRRLDQAAKWAAEQLVGLPLTDECQRSSSAGQAARETPVSDSYLLAMSYFDHKEYKRAAHLLQQEAGSKPFFLRMYSLYLAGEKRKEEERMETPTIPSKVQAHNRELEDVQQHLQDARTRGQADGFALYLLGLVLIDREQKEQARTVLTEAVTAFPCNWSAWQALQQVCLDREATPELSLPRHWVRDFYHASLCLEMQENQEALSRLQALSEQFPRSDWIVAQAATAQYSLRNFDDAQELFEDLLERDPERVETMDIYSNILYVKENFPALSHLAHRTAVTDKYRPESCCIIGNYYSLKGLHTKAVTYFLRALKLNRNYLSAWTLMGHEYVEMKNIPAAIEVYRRAVDLNPRDYRAWYGLGQTYELLHMPYHALYYFSILACVFEALRLNMLTPNVIYTTSVKFDQCYENEQLKAVDQDKMELAAIQCYSRAVANGDREGIALHKMARALLTWLATTDVDQLDIAMHKQAKLHQARGETDKAAHYYRTNLDRIEAENISGSDQLDALLYLAEYAKDIGNLNDAEAYCMQLLDYGAPSKERAKSMLREIRGMQRQQQAAAEAAAGRRSNAGGFATPAPMPLGSPPEHQQPSPGSDIDISSMT